MSASNNNWVHFHRCFAIQRPVFMCVAKCSKRGISLYCPSDKVEVLREVDERVGRKLHLENHRRLLAWSDRQAVQRVRVAHGAECEAARLHAMALVKGRYKTIRRLKEKVRAKRRISHQTW